MIELPPKSFPEYRTDPVTGHWVLIATERAYRPMKGPSNSTTQADTKKDCPFCEGKEALTPPEIYALREGSAPNSPGWELRILRNAFPAVGGMEGIVETEDRAPDLSASSPGYGIHELVIERPDHKATITDLPDEKISRILIGYRDRVRSLHGLPGISVASVFKNCGIPAGASQEHVHTQILATTHVPPNLFKELVGASTYYDQHSRCIYCEMIAASGNRMVLESEHFVAFCPYAPRFPHETWICPRAHEGRFETLTNDLFLELAALLRRILASIESLLNPASYNYFIHSLPTVERDEQFYHWHLEITPRVLGIAGIEVGGGVFINPYPPEWSAIRLRDAIKSLPN